MKAFIFALMVGLSIGFIAGFVYEQDKVMENMIWREYEYKLMFFQEATKFLKNNVKK